MTKADIAERIAFVNGFTKLESMDLVESVLSIIKDTLAEGEVVIGSGVRFFCYKGKGQPARSQSPDRRGNHH